MAYNVEKLSTIDLGRQGENLARTVEIDVHPLLEQWPDAVISLLCKRKHDTNPYVAVTEVRDGILVWPITSVETETAGDGKIELRAVCGEVIAKSMTAVIRVTASLTGSETEAPDAAQGWVDQVLAAGSAAEENAKVAQDAATRAENAAADIDAAVDNAEAAAKAAEEQAGLAGDHASAAGLSATEAGEDAQRAEQAANAAEEFAASAQDSASEADLSRQGADASAQAALDEYNKAAEKAEAAQVSAATAEQSASDAKKSKTAAEQSASAAKSSETNAAKSAEAAAKSASDASASKDAAAGSASVARSSEENAAKSAENAAASATAAEKSKEGIDEALASAAESAKDAGQSAENSEASAARSEAAAQAALTIIDDENVGTERTWSSQNLLDRLTVPFEKKGAIVQCYPVEDSPLSVVATIEPVQHFDWANKTAESTQVTTTGKNLCGIGTITVSKYDLVPIGTTLAAGTYTISAVVSSDDTDYSACLISFYNGETATGVTATLARSTERTSRVITLETEATHMYLYASQGFNQSEGDTVTFADFQIEAGAAATTYEPYTGGKPSPSPDYPQEIVDSIPAGSYYVPSTAPKGGYWKITLDEALGGVKDYMDVIEVDSFTGRCRIVRNSARVELNTDTVFLKQGVGDNAYFVTALAPEATEAYQLSSFCSHFPVINLLGGNTLQGNGGWKSSLYIRWGESFDTDAELNAYVAGQYNAGTPITVRYARAEAEVSTVQTEHVTSTTGLTMLNASSMGLTAPDPYHTCGIAVAQTLETKRCGKNLLDKSSAYQISYSAGIPFISGSVISTYPYTPGGKSGGVGYIVPCVKGATYTIYLEKDVDYAGFGLSEYARLDDARKTVNSLGHISCWEYHNGKPTAYTAKSNGVLLCAISSVWGNNENTYTITGREKFQLELGSVATSCESYHGDNYETDLPDGFDGGNYDVTRGNIWFEWAKKVLDGTEAWNRYSYTDAFYIQIPDSIYNDKNELLTRAVCNSFATRYFYQSKTSGYLDSAESGFAQEAGGTRNYAFRMSGITDVEEWKAYLAERNASGNPVVIFYKLQKPTAMGVTARSIPAIPGVNTITTDATTLTVSGHADPIRIITNLTERVAALEDAAATE